MSYLRLSDLEASSAITTGAPIDGEMGPRVHSCLSFPALSEPAHARFSRAVKGALHPDSAAGSLARSDGPDAKAWGPICVSIGNLPPR
jgi:hypothetical protein